VYTLLVKVLVTVWEWFMGRRPFTYSRAEKRHIDAIATQQDAAAPVGLLCQLDLTRDMTYRGPLYSGDIQTTFGNMYWSRCAKYGCKLLDGFDGGLVCLDWLTVPTWVDAKGFCHPRRE
jgi:hypothetical protein